tara:strand:- start:1680 stop:2327 length:648 start_codon:yes stop_codon:yes gene_type:complete
MSTQGGPNIVTDGLVLALDAANQKSYPGSGTAWNDLSGNANTGTLTNGPTFDSGNSGAISFDGTNDLVECSAISSTNFTNSVWMMVDTKDINGIISWTVGTVRRELLFVEGDISIVYGSSKYKRGPVLANGVWTNVVGTYDGTTPLIYVNGVSQTLGSELAGGAGAADKCYIGRTAFATPYYFDGKIADVKIYNKALTSVEILQNYNATKGRFGL